MMYWVFFLFMVPTLQCTDGSHTPSMTYSLRNLDRQRPQAAHTHTQTKATLCDRYDHLCEIEEKLLQEERARKTQENIAWEQRCRDMRFKHYDVTWFSQEARCVATRCRAINFLNIDPRHLTIPPSQLPPGFRDTFEKQDAWYKRIDLYCRYDIDDFKNDLAQRANCRTTELVSTCPSEQIKAYMRAEMRNWGRYNQPLFREMLKTLTVHDDYMHEIGAQLAHDAEFREKVQSVRKEAAHYIASQYALLSQADKVKREQASQEQREYKQQQETYERQLIDEALGAVFADCSTRDQSTLRQEATGWNFSHPARSFAYQRALAYPNTQERKSYVIDPVMQRAIEEAGGPDCFCCEPELIMAGNALQHELMEEIVDLIHRWVEIKLPFDDYSFERALYRDSMMLLESAYLNNRLGSCGSSAKLIDAGASIIDYCKALADGLVCGGLQGVQNSALGIVETFSHPIVAAQHMGAMAGKIASLIHNYMPPQLPECDDGASQESWIGYHQQCDLVERNWRDAAQAVKRLFRKKPSVAEVRNAAYVVGNVSGNILTGHVCSKLAGSLASLAKGPMLIAGSTTAQAMRSTQLAQRILRQSEKIQCAVAMRALKLQEKYRSFVRDYMPTLEPVFLTQAENGIVLRTADHVNFEAQTATSTAGILFPENISAAAPRIAPYKKLRGPATPPETTLRDLNQGHVALAMRRKNYLTMPMNKVKQQVAKRALELNMSPADINKILANFNDTRLDGCLRNFNQAIHELHHIKGAKQLIETTFKDIAKGCFKRGRGALYELHAALKLQEEGHVIVEFSRNVWCSELEGFREYDIVTPQDIIECKNLHWENQVGSIEFLKSKKSAIGRLCGQCDKGVEYASSQGVSYCVVFKVSIPEHFEWLRTYLANKGVCVIDNFI